MSHVSTLISVVLILLRASFGFSQGLNDNDCKYIGLVRHNYDSEDNECINIYFSCS